MYDFRDATGEQAGREIDRTRERRRPASRHQSDGFIYGTYDLAWKWVNASLPERAHAVSFLE